jgi:hypothetical protein
MLPDDKALHVGRSPQLHQVLVPQCRQDPCSQTHAHNNSQIHSKVVKGNKAMLVGCSVVTLELRVRTVGDPAGRASIFDPP